MKKTSKGRAILFIICSSLFFTTMNTFGKLASSATAYQKTFISNIVATIIICSIIIYKKESLIGKKENRKYLLARGILGTLSISALYYSIDYLVLADSTMLSKLSPFFTLIFSYLILKEKVSHKQCIYLIVAFIGSLFIIKPQFNSSILPALIGVLSAITAGLAYTMIRILGNKEGFYTIILSFTGIATIVTFPSIFYNTSNLTLDNIIYLILGGLCFTAGQFFLTLAYKNAPASEISMYDYIGLIFAAIYGFLLFNESPDSLSILGYIIILSSSILNSLSNKGVKYKKQ